MNHQSPLVTIITPSFNQGKFIEETIKSVLNQGYSNLEYIVIDGGSTDNTLEILKKYDGQLQWISEKDKGQSDAINKGFKMAKGEIVAWLNSDDTYEPGAIQKAVDYMAAHKNVALVYGEGDIIDEHSNKVKRFEATQEFDLWTLIHVWDYIMQPTTFFRSRALQEVGYLDEHLHWCMDWDLWIKLGQKYEVGYIADVLANSREYAETKTSTGGWKRLREIVSLMKKYGNMKYPYGMFLYGASTVYTKLVGTPLFGTFSRYLLATVHRNIFGRLPIRYADNWVGTRLVACIPSSKSEITISGNVIFPQVLPLQVSVYVNDKLAHQQLISVLGQFHLKIELGEKEQGCHFLVVRSDKSTIPYQINRELKDGRRLSFLVEEIKS